MKTTLLLLSFFLVTSTFSQNWVQTNAANAAVGSDGYVQVAHLGDTIFAIGNDLSTYNNLSVSLDEGATWGPSVSILENDYGQTAQILGVENLVYIALKLPFDDYLYYHSSDLGTTWVLDTVGLPHYYNMPTTHKEAFLLEKLSNGYVVGFTMIASNGAYIKHETDAEWTEVTTYNGKVHFDFTYIGNTWYSLNGWSMNNAEKITSSTDNGATWNPVPLSGLPTGFEPLKLESNHVNRLFITGSLAGTNANAVYYSNDGGNTWQATNAASLQTHTNAIPTDIYAVGDHVYVGYSPDSQDTVTRFLVSTTATPNFQVGNTTNITVDNSGLFPYLSPSLEFFSTTNKLFIRYLDDVYASNGSFGQISGLASESIENRVYPNPFDTEINVFAQENSTISLYDATGKQITSFTLQPGNNNLDLMDLTPGVYWIHFENGEVQRILKN